MTDIEGISEGRKQVALEKADEARREWMRAERAEAEVARLRAALKPFADAARPHKKPTPDFARALEVYDSTALPTEKSND